MTVLWMGLAVLVAAVPVTWWLDRTFARYEREAVVRAAMRLPQAQEIARAFKAMKVAVGVALMPALVRATRSLVETDEAMRKFNESMRGNDGGLARLRRLAEQINQGER